MIMMEPATKEYVVRNSLAYAYDALRSKERLIGESTNSYYENYFQQSLERLGPPGKKWDLTIPNSEVESFYLGRITLGEFRLNTQERVFSKIQGWDLAPLFSLIWSECCSVPDKASLCSKLDAGVGRQLWEIFLSLDVESQGKIHVEDLCDLIQRVLRENGHVESEQNIKEWFCEEILIDFWSFFAAIVENYAGLLKPNIIRALHELIVSETLLCGRLTKKGHKIHSWKERWFTLQPTQLSYYESQENMLLKGTIAIGLSTQFEFMPDSKGHQRRFRIIDGQTQVPYEICTPDVNSLQLWNNGLQVAIAMNKVSGNNFLHRLTQAQKQVFPENSTFGTNAVTISRLSAPTSPSHHPSLVPSESVPLAKISKPPPQPPSPYDKKRSGAKLQHQSSFPESGVPNENLDDPPPVPQQRYIDVSSVVPLRQKPQGLAGSNALEVKAKRRHSSITYSSEFEREQEREREKLEHVNVGGAMYAVVTKPNKGSKPNTPDRVTSPPIPPAKGVPPGREVRRIRPKTPSPSAQRRGYIQLEFQNGNSNLQAQNSIPSAANRNIPPDIRTKWNYTTVVFDKNAQKEKEFENDGTTTKKNKPLPPPPGSGNSTSDSNIVAPQPAPRQRKPQSLTDIKQPAERGMNYVDVDFSPSSSTPTQNGGRELPKLPPKDPPELPPKEDGKIKKELPRLPPKDLGDGNKQLPLVPPKDDSSSKKELPRLPPRDDIDGRRELPQLPLKDDSRVDSPTQSKPLPRPRPVPRQRMMSPAEAPPPIPMRRSPNPPA